MVERSRDRLGAIQRELMALAADTGPDDRGREVAELVDVVRRIRTLSADTPPDEERVWQAVLFRLDACEQPDGASESADLSDP